MFLINNHNKNDPRINLALEEYCLRNLNYSFIKPYEKHSLVNIKDIIGPIVKALNRLGVPAVINGSNDMVVNGKKISGNAQFSDTKGIIVHGTLLLDTDLKIEAQVLGVRKKHVTSKARKSNRSPVANINEHLNEAIGMTGFRNYLLSALNENCDG